MNEYLERAVDQRVNDFITVRNWVFDQIDNNLPQFAHDLACLLRGADKPADDPNWDYRLADWAAVDAIRGRMGEAIAAQPATQALADELRQEAEEEARESEEGAWYGNPYLEACHDAEVRSARLAQARLDEAERDCV